MIQFDVSFVPRALIRAKVVMFMFAHMAYSSYEYGVVLRFVRGYSKDEVKRERARREKWLLEKYNSPTSEAVEKYRRSVQGLIPLRELDGDPYALVLYFDAIDDDYTLKWISISSLQPATTSNRGKKSPLKKRHPPMITSCITRKKKYEPAHDKALVRELSLTHDDGSWLENLLPRKVQKPKDSHVLSRAVRRNLLQSSSGSSTSWLEKLLPPKKRNSPKDPPESEHAIYVPPKKPKGSGGKEAHVQ